MTACRFVKKKGLDFLINAFHQLENEFPDIELIIIGDGPMKKKLLRTTPSKNIHFLGKKSSEDIPNYFWTSDLFVLCSREIINKKTGYIDAETMGRVLCEANASSLPVLASNSGGINSIITDEDNGLLYETDQFNSFRKQFVRLYSDTDLRARLIRNGKVKSQSSHDWSILLEKHLNIFNDLIKNKN